MIAKLFRRKTAKPAQPEPLVIMPVPALVDVLEELEAAKGAPLSEAEVWQARDNAVCVRVPPGEAEAIRARERFHIAPHTAWADWCAYRDAQSDYKAAAQ
ncbi:hypothetical protein [Ancylobacter radicis]|uniref:Uncharacterized protein n=1 Tax=Ancylobacter radicis TaxID=2836179 RepID=A0ABS5RAH7_9HYPH|nr:hypothetical protein [Ancylobacter radicis]MBS9477342.1 hypothetical protein [Ancylobacter radicis]